MEVVNIPNGSVSSSLSSNNISTQDSPINGSPNTDRKRKSEVEKEEKKVQKESYKVKYVGETNRSGYERGREHVKQFMNMEEGSHLIKHYLQCHRNIQMEEMEFGMKVRASFKSAIERQISEAVAISLEEKSGTKLMNSKAEYNRCKLPRLNTQSIEDQIKEIEAERKRNKEISAEIRDLKEKKKSRKNEEMEDDNEKKKKH